jgi:integrase/recombinase XerD
MGWSSLLVSAVESDGRCSYRLGHELVDEFLEFVAGRCRPNTVRAYAHDLKAFFDVVGKDPGEVTSREVLAFVVAQQRPRPGAENLVRICDGGAGLSASTIKRRLAAVSSLFGYLVVRGDAGVVSNPVPRGVPTRRSRHRDQRGVPLVRGVRRLPQILEAGEVDMLLGLLRTVRDRVMIEAMLLGGLRGARVAAHRSASG